MPSTLTIHPDEKAYALVELNLQSPSMKGFHRYQILLVNRDDELTEYRWDLGPTDNFTSREFRIPALWLHTVGEVQDMADDLRDTTSQPNELLPVADGDDMLQRALDLDQAVRDHRKGKRNF